MFDNIFAKGSIYDLVLHGTVFAYVILGILLLMSLIAWTVAFYKYFFFRKIITASTGFLKIFYEQEKISETSGFIDEFQPAYTAELFRSTYKEYSKFYLKHKHLLEKKGNDSGAIERIRGLKGELLGRLERNIEKTIALQSKEHENGLNTLAIISSTSPYLGLLGTVTGIIDAFLHIGTEGVTSLSAIAPGIAEALVTTAFGLLTAIPALMVYNFLRSQLRKIETEQYAFGLELLNIFDKSL